VGASEGDHEDLSIWPPAIEDDSNGQMVRPIAFFQFDHFIHSVTNSMLGATGARDGSTSVA